jgi:hypothetical protein
MQVSLGFSVSLCFLPIQRFPAGGNDHCAKKGNLTNSAVPSDSLVGEKLQRIFRSLEKKPCHLAWLICSGSPFRGSGEFPGKNQGESQRNGQGSFTPCFHGFRVGLFRSLEPLSQGRKWASCQANSACRLIVMINSRPECQRFDAVFRGD